MGTLCVDHELCCKNGPRDLGLDAKNLWKPCMRFKREPPTSHYLLSLMHTLYLNPVIKSMRQYVIAEMDNLSP